MKEEVRSFLVRDGGVRFVRVFSRLKVNDELLILGPPHISFQIVQQSLVPDHIRETAFGRAMEDLL